MTGLAYSPPARRALEPVSEIDRLLFTERGREDDLQDDLLLRTELVRESVIDHLDRCPAYASFARHLDFEVESLKDPSDLERVPQLPTTAFKRGPVVSMPLEATAKLCTSSGTQGSVSTVYRDRTTIERLLGTVGRGIELLGEWYEDDVHVLNLGPDQVEAGDLWFAYVMSLIALMHPTRHAVVEGSFDPDAALRDLEQMASSVPAPVVIGPPSLVMRVAGAALKRGGVPLASLTVVTAGGWKRDDGKRTERAELSDMVVRAFGMDDDRQVRDAFNQVELNTVMIECACHRKHVPPWLHVITRSLSTLAPVAEGEPGLLSYLDPSAASYPCFIVADDLGTVHNGPCDCGWPGRTLTVMRRLERSESWGCALKMDRAWGGASR